ncbi:cell envelope-related function transcriptional attenuator common domain-containing protein [Halolactibacillus halophilus]|uniref:Cell envelope-related function transcriptional attenuator common domain-containing protein n=1 Tax=Halolactibacillus halophilus TaxID=306540 RepID=A0A1I5QH72_9BACI|nr:LCP family protein [Halolactibacillus halophilus]GEM02125.1 LytR family transcriptional regulator [Halolactibacillus halophilus]SFP45236.1 cell envelope-related function transcriptional attenuator common domain-containing protein [Halolactibacillus halophilus]
MHQNNEYSRLKKRKQKKRRLIIYIAIPILIFIGLGATYVGAVLNKAENVVSSSYEDDGREQGSELREEIPDPTKDNISILFVGIDQGGARQDPNTKGLSDALILATFNKQDHSVKMLSIPRDSYVYVPSEDTFTKITHAHAYDGVKGSIDTIEHLLDIPIDYYVRLNFDAFIDVIDALNGVKVDVPYEVYEMDSNDVEGAIHLVPGEQLLSGEEALAFARTRRKDSDLERVKRQQQLMSAILDRAISMNAVVNITTLFDAVGDNMTTNLNWNEIKSLSSYALSGDLTIENLSLEGYDKWEDAYYFGLDEEHLEEVKDTLRTHLDLDVSSSINDTY